MKASERVKRLVAISLKVTEALSVEVFKLNMSDDENYKTMMGCLGLAGASVISSALKRSTLTKEELMARMVLMANEFTNEDL